MKECQNIEWKENWNDDYLKWVCAFANAEGGSICVGIDDSGKIYPLKNEKKLLEDLPNKIRDVLGIIADVKLIPTESGDYIRIDVPAYPHLISYHGRFYYRSGSTTQELKGSALERMFLKKQGVTWDSITEPGASLNDLSSEAFALFKNAAKKHGRMQNIDMDSESQETILRNLNLVENGSLNRAGILLFHRNPERFIPGSYVKIGFFQSDADLLYQDDIHGPLFQQVEKTVDLLLTKYMKAYISYEGITRVEKYLFDPDAIREAVLNCIIHKEYSSLIPIQIKVYDDKIYFYNSGVLPDNWTIEKLYQSHGSRPFNPLIAEAFFRTGAIESWGRGISKIIEACRKGGIADPVYEFYSGSGYCLQLNASAKLAGIKEKIQKEIDGQEKVSPSTDISLTASLTMSRIVDILRNNRALTGSEIAGVLGVSARTVYRKLAQLQQDGVIKRIGTDRDGYWLIIAESDKSYSIKASQDAPQIEDLHNKLHDKLHDKFTPNSQKIIDLMKRNPQITGQQIAEELGLSIRTVRTEILNLRNNNVIERIGSNKTGYWQVKNELTDEEKN